MNINYQIKVITLGEIAVGKSSILRTWTQDTTRVKGSTIGVDYFSKTTTIIDDYLCHNYNLQIWDTAGQELYRSLIRSYYRNVYVVILVFDLNDPESFNELLYWIHDLRMNCEEKELMFYLVGNKNDLVQKVKQEDINGLVNQFKMVYFSTSTVNKTNINELFMHIVNSIHQKFKELKKDNKLNKWLELNNITMVNRPLVEKRPTMFNKC
jgi:small GTP-binding protein